MIPSDERAKLSRHLFWDVPQNESNINRIIDENADWLIERVFEHGTMDDIRMIIRWYGKEKVVRVLCDAESLAKVTVGFACALFDLKKSDFKCYMKKQFHPIYY